MTDDALFIVFTVGAAVAGIAVPARIRWQLWGIVTCVFALYHLHPLHLSTVTSTCILLHKWRRMLLQGKE
jgi:uncharacterized membrane protein YoaK (UPF0700 family)